MIFIFLTFVFFFDFWEFSNSIRSQKIACYSETTSNTLQELEECVALDNGIFFLETMCHTEPGIHLSPRQACAVESAAKMNPGKEVYVLFPGPVMDNVTSLFASVQQLLLYPNVRLRHINMKRYFANSPLQDWYDSGILYTSDWPVQHSSDVLRLVTLWRFGGIYLDLDVVVMKPLTGMMNFAGAESNPSIGNAVLSFSHEGIGREVVDLCLKDLRRNFRGYQWSSNGPGAITRVLKKVCNTSVFSNMAHGQCRGFTVFPPQAFYPIHWTEWRQYFSETYSKQVTRRVKDSYAIHVWNKLSSQVHVIVGSSQPYAVIASQFCPRVYQHVGQEVF